MVFLIVVMQFNSVLQPFLVLIGVVLALGGVYWGLSIMQVPFAIMMTGIGMNMLATQKHGSKEEEEEREAARQKVDISFSPLAMPMLSGPGSIAVTLGFSSLATQALDYVAIILGIVVVALASYFVLRVSGKIVKFIGPVGMNAMTKIMGFLTMCIGVQFVVNGILGIATDPELLRGIKSVLTEH